MQPITHRVRCVQRGRTTFIPAYGVSDARRVAGGAARSGAVAHILTLDETR